MRALLLMTLFVAGCADNDSGSSKLQSDAAGMDAREGGSGDGGQSGTGGASGAAGNRGGSGTRGGGDGGGANADAGMGDATLDGPGTSADEAGVAIATFSGHTLDAFVGTAIAMTNLTTNTSQGPVNVTSDEGGAYAIELDVGEVFAPVVSHSQYRATRNPTHDVASSATVDLELVSIADATRQYTHSSVWR